MPSTDEAALIAAAQAGDTGARNELVIKYLPAIEKLACIRWKRETGLEVDDLIQIGALALMQCIPRYVLGEFGLWTFAYRRIQGAMTDAIKRSMCRHRSGKRTLPIQLGDWDAAVAGNVPLVETRHDAAIYLDMLTPTRRAVIEQYYAGLSRRQIAANLHLSHNHVTNVLVEARHRIRLFANLDAPARACGRN